MSLSEMTATAFRKLCLPSTLGLGTTFQFVPSQCSMSVAVGASILEPTAQMLLCDNALMPLRVPETGFGTLLQPHTRDEEGCDKVTAVSVLVGVTWASAIFDIACETDVGVTAPSPAGSGSLLDFNMTHSPTNSSRTTTASIPRY